MCFNPSTGRNNKVSWNIFESHRTKCRQMIGVKKRFFRFCFCFMPLLLKSSDGKNIWVTKNKVSSNDWSKNQVFESRRRKCYKTYLSHKEQSVSKWFWVKICDLTHIMPKCPVTYLSHKEQSVMRVIWIRKCDVTLIITKCRGSYLSHT